MKKIEFGFSNDAVPTGQWEGIGIAPGLILTDAEYYGSFSIDGYNFIVAKPTSDEYGNYPDMVGKFIVREALVDLYADGSSNVFLNQDVSSGVEGRFGELLDRAAQSGTIKSGEDFIIDVARIAIPNAHGTSKAFKLAEMDERIIATSITPEAFKAKKEALKNCHQSFSQLGTNTGFHM